MTGTLAALIALTFWVAMTGGGRLELGTIEVSVRDWRRPAVLCVVFAAFAVFRLRSRRLDSAVTTGMLALLLLVLALWSTYLVMACGGLDSYGYVSTARLLTEGRLTLDQPSAWLPIPRALDALTPLGYIASADGARIVPEFPIGLPLVMALFMVGFGTSGAFYVAPVLAAGALVAAAALVHSVSGRWAALLASALLAVQPVFFAYALQPMSDVAAAFWLVLAAALLLRDSPYALAAGVAAGLAFWTRPPLGAAALLLPLLPLASRHGRVRYWSALAVMIAMLAGVQWLLYGNPVVSGHGSAGQLFTLAALPHNLEVHGRWLLVENTVLLPLALAAAGWLGNRRLFLSAIALFAAVAAPYMLYAVPFDDWEMQRFLLPGLAFLLMSAADGLCAACNRWMPRPAAAAAILGIVWLLAFGSYDFLQRQQLFQRANAEAKFPRVGGWLADRAAAGDVAFAALHSGSIRFYSTMTTIRWDRVQPGVLTEAVRAIERRGGRAFLVLDGNSERQLFRSRFGGELSGVEIEFVDRIGTVDLATVAVRP